MSGIKNDKPTPIKFAELPTVLQLEDEDDVAQARDLLIRLDTALSLEKECKRTGDEVKAKLRALQRSKDLRGLRDGSLCYFSREVPGKRTLDKMMLIENGVGAEVIEDSMKTGKPYVEYRFKNLKLEDEDE